MAAKNDVPDLIERARQGDREAFDQLASFHKAALLARIRNRMGPTLRGKLDPEDVLQETFFRAFRSVEHFRWQGDASFERWLEGIATNFILHSARTFGRKRELQIVSDPEAEQVSPSRSEQRHERFDRLKRSLDDLSPDYRKVLQLSRIEGLKISEIADRMDRSQNAVKSLLLRALKQLRETFGDTESLNLPEGHFDEESAVDGD